ncbi:hypothetical protein VAE122_3170009 [Vibrio aestuarianus]|nr:hypothetical protein VAE122_3170009 [Vibrio aestuarianus]
MALTISVPARLNSVFKVQAVIAHAVLIKGNTRITRIHDAFTTYLIAHYSISLSNSERQKSGAGY